MTYLRGGDVGAGLAVGGAGEGGGHIDVPPDAVEEPAERQREVEGAEGPDDVVAAEDKAAEDDRRRPQPEEGEHACEGGEGGGGEG